MNKKKLVAIDFDAVIAEYDKWKGIGKFGDPINGVKESLNKVRSSGIEILIYTTRGEKELICEYLNRNEIPFDYINECPLNEEHNYSGKPIAYCYIDDRAIEFNGVWNNLLVDKIINFKSYYETEKKNPKDLLLEFSNIFNLKNGEKGYNNSYKKFGEVCHQLFPKGLNLYSIDDFNKIGIFFMILHKLIRASSCVSSQDKEKLGSSLDSIKDLSIYSSMLYEIVENLK